MMVKMTAHELRWRQLLFFRLINLLENLLYDPRNMCSFYSTKCQTFGCTLKLLHVWMIWQNGWVSVSHFNVYLVQCGYTHNAIERHGQWFWMERKNCLYLVQLRDWNSWALLFPLPKTLFTLDQCYWVLLIRIWNGKVRKTVILIWSYHPKLYEVGSQLQILFC